MCIRDRNCANAMAGFRQMVGKMNKTIEMPNAHVVMANKCPEPWYFVSFKTVSA